MKHLSLALALVLLLSAVCIAQDVPKAEVFLGYAYTRVNSATNVPAFSANGGNGQFVVNFGKWFGAVADLGAVHNGNIGGYHLDTTLTNFLFGPRIPIRVSKRVTPYFQTLFGGVQAATSTKVEIPAGTPTNPIVIPPTVAPTPGGAIALRAVHSQTAFAMAVGGGLDIRLNHVVSLRPIAVDYFLTRLQNLRSMDDNNQHNLRFTTGLNFTFGGESAAPTSPPSPPMRSCWNGSSVPQNSECPKRDMALNLTAGQTEVCSGATVTVTPSADMPPGSALQWTVNGEAVSKASPFEFGTTGRDPGTYTIGLTAAAPEYNNASARTVVTLLPYRAPSGTVQVLPAEIWAGEEAAVSATFTPGQCGGSVGTPEISAAEGSISGGKFDSSGVQFDPANNAEQRKTVRLMARATDQQAAATAEGSILVKRKAIIQAKRLPDVIFPASSARVNNCGKRVLLEELKSLIDQDPTGKVVFVGHITANERSGLDQQRAMNSAAVISAGQGICTGFPASQVLVSATGVSDNGVDLQPHFCGTSVIPKTNELSGQGVTESDDQTKYRRVEVWFVPTGGIVPASLKEYQDASALPVSSLGCPK